MVQILGYGLATGNSLVYLFFFILLYPAVYTIFFFPFVCKIIDKKVENKYKKKGNKKYE